MVERPKPLRMSKPFVLKIGQAPQFYCKKPAESKTTETIRYRPFRP